MAETAQERLDTQREKLQASIDELNKRRSATNDSKVKKRLNGQIKAKTRQLNDLNQRRAGMRTGIDPKGGSAKRVPSQPTMQLHHAGSSLHNAAPFFEGLDVPEKLLMERRFAQLGIVPGDVTMNALAMFTPLHQAGIHKLERDLNLEGKQYFKPGASFQEKLEAVEAFAADQRYLQRVAQEAQFKAQFESGGVRMRVEATPTAETSAQFEDIERRRAKEVTRDIREYGPETHRIAGAQVRPPQTGAQMPSMELKEGKPVISKAKSPRIKPQAAKGSMRLMYAGGMDDIPEIRDEFNLDPRFGTPLGGGRSVQMGDYSFGTV